MTLPEMILGVELEFAIRGNDANKHEMYKSAFPVVKSYPKGGVWGHTHAGNGNLVKMVEEATGGFVRVGYDATVAQEPDGWECYSQPGPFIDQLQGWSAFWTSGITDYMTVGVIGKTQFGNPKSCGMHVHVSGPAMRPTTIANLLLFMNNRENSPLLRYLAGRYDGHYCKIIDGLTWTSALSIMHSSTCSKHAGKRITQDDQLGIEELTPGGHFSFPYCCNNAKQRVAFGWDRHTALNICTTPGTGDVEFRLFETPTSKERFLANLEFVHALVSYCYHTSPRETNYRVFCEWLMQEPIRRVRYTNLFKWLREAEYVKGLIPRRNRTNAAAGATSSA